MLIKRLTAIKFFVCAICFINLVALANQADDEAGFRRDLGVAPGAVVKYQDEAGTTITFHDFIEKTSAGQSFSFKHSASEASFTLQAKNAPKSDKPQRYKLAAGEPLPEFHLTSLEQQAFDNKALVGRVTLISFFFADCLPCNAEVPALNKYRQQHPDLNLLAITYDDLETANGFQSKRHLAWPVIPNGKSFIDAIGIDYYPTFALIDGHGKLLGIKAISAKLVAGASAPSVDATELTAWVDELVGKNRSVSLSTNILQPSN